MKTFDDIIIGSGPVAFTMVPGLRAAHKKVLVVENQDFGGVCPNRGCEPKIFLEGAVTTALTSKKLQNLGIELPATINWQQLIQRKKAVFAPYPSDSVEGYQAMGAETVHGTATFVSSHVLAINGEQYQAKNIIIATGQRPNQLPIAGHAYTVDSDTIFDMEKLPQRIAFIGGGFVSMELATMLRAAGSTVDIIEFAERPLQAFSAEHVAIVMDEMHEQRINFHFGQAVTKVEKSADKFRVITQQGLKLDVDVVVDTSGRVPNVEKLNLAAAGVKHDRQGVIVDEHFETNIAGVYALGDVAKKDAPKLTSTAHYEGKYLSAYLTNQVADGLNYPVVATAAFTFPQIAQVGVRLDEARHSDSYQVKDYDLAKTAHAYVGVNDMAAKLTLIFNQQEQLVGAAEVSQTAVDDINNFVDMIGSNSTPKAWKQMAIPVFPSLAYKVHDLTGH